MKKPSQNNSAIHESFLAYKNYRYLKISVFIALLSLLGYYSTDFDPSRNGGTWYGYTLGTIATLLILWLSLLGIRKRWISKAGYSLKSWTSAHVYLGLSLIIIATLHAGFQFGWNVHTLAYTLMMIVIFSGVLGIYFYMQIPHKMSQNRGEMSQSDMLEVLRNIDRLLEETALPLDSSLIDKLQDSIQKTSLGGSFLKRISGRDKKCPTRKALIFMQNQLAGAPPENRSEILDVISVLERKNAILIRIRRHIKYKALLGGWLYLHIPFTFALIAALSAHIISVFYYS